MLIKCSFKGEHLWLGVLSVNDERETVVGRVSNHPINRGLMFGQKIQIPIEYIYMIFYTKIYLLYIKIMYAKITKSKTDGFFYDYDKIPIKTVRFGAESYDDYTVAPHDEDKNARYIKRQCC